MIKNVKVTNHLGETLLLELRSPEKSGFFVRGIEGLGPSKSIINTTETLSSDGSFYNSSRIQPRNLVFDLGFYNDGQQSIETIRQETYRFFPMKKPITFEIETDNRIGITTGHVESNEPNIFSKEENTIISVICPSAFFFDKTIVDTFFSGINSNFEFPWENPSLTLSLIEFGLVFISNQNSLYYSGDEETGVVIYINFLAAFNSPIYIYNFTKSQTMLINTPVITSIMGGLGPTAGDLLVISTIKGNKAITFVRGGVYYNVLNSLDVLSDWFTVQRGDNVFGYSAAVGQELLHFHIQHQIVYGGL